MAKKDRHFRSRNFDFAAPFYDLSMWFAGLFFGGELRFREAIIKEAAPLKGMAALEIFSGTATVSLMAAKEGASVTALDISKGMLRVAGEKARKQKISIERVRGDSVSLPFHDGTFDRVFASFGLHEIPVPMAAATIKESQRVLKKGGRLVILDFHRASGMAGFLQNLLFLFVEGKEARAWTSTDIQGLLRKTGFRGFNRTFLLKGALQLISVYKH
ncbi:MAG: hypothetical protein BMS9Abin23_1095 [Thermodesulfobacteriota bacterium]|nr:MAG: hypothetical protein BMS9Abin23_1095 [Thermodesulfobacteriota bacterium]